MRIHTSLLSLLLICIMSLMLAPGCGVKAGGADASALPSDSTLDIDDAFSEGIHAEDASTPDASLEDSEDDTMNAPEDTAIPDASGDVIPSEDVSTQDTAPEDSSTNPQDAGTQEDTNIPPLLGALSIEGPNVTVPGSCVMLWVSRTELTDTNFEVSLSGNAGGFFTDDDCSIPLDTVTLGPDIASVSVWASGAAPGTATLNASAPQWESAEQALEIAANTYASTSVDEVLVVYNTNSEGADIATTTEKRGIALERICPVSLPQGLFATPEHLGARQQLLTCLCNIDAEQPQMLAIPRESCCKPRPSPISPSSEGSLRASRAPLGNG